MSNSKAELIIKAIQNAEMLCKLSLSNTVITQSFVINKIEIPELKFMIGGFAHLVYSSSDVAELTIQSYQGSVDNSAGSKENKRKEFQLYSTSAEEGIFVNGIGKDGILHHHGVAHITKTWGQAVAGVLVGEHYQLFKDNGLFEPQVFPNFTTQVTKRDGSPLENVTSEISSVLDYQLLLVKLHMRAHLFRDAVTSELPETKKQQIREMNRAAHMLLKLDLFDNLLKKTSLT